MSFGFGVGDFAGTLQLAWTLYTNCYKVAKGAPQDFRALVQEINTLHSSIKFLQEEVINPNSTLVRAGDDRVEMLKRIMDQVNVTLRDLEKHSKKYEKLGKAHSSSIRKWWTGVKWSAEASDLDALRNKLVYHNGVISLLLTSCGNSSLQRLESIAQKVDQGVNDIKGMIKSSEAPMISVIGGDRVFTISLSATLMKNAEVGRKWSAIGVDEWIQAGSWWLLKSQANLYTGSPSDRKITKQGYADLIKAAWILIDIITRHPQLDFLETSMGYGVELLAETIRRELQNINALGLQKPGLEDLNTCDLVIWEIEVKEPTLQPGKKTLDSGLSYQAWATEHEYVLFQRFVYYQQNTYREPAPCIILFLMHKKDKKARIVLRDQSWVTLATFIVGDMSPLPIDNVLQIGDQKIELSTSVDVKHLCLISEAAEEYLLYCKHSDNNPETMETITLLFSIKNKYQDVTERLIGDENIDDLEQLAKSQNASFSTRAQLAAHQLALKSIEGGICGINQYESKGSYETLLSWASREGYGAVAALLAEAKGVLTSQGEIYVCSSLNNAARNGNIELLRLFLSERGVDMNLEDDDGWTALELAIWGGHETIVKELLEMGVYSEVLMNRYKAGFTGLQFAAGKGYKAIVEILLKSGTNVNTPASDKCEEGVSITNRISQAYVSGDNPEMYESGRTALQAAAGGGHIAIVNRLLEVGANVHAEPEKCGYTALQAAAQGGHIAVVNRLLGVYANVNAKPSKYYGRTALQAAAGGGNIVVVDRLLEAGADLKAAPSSYYGRTALQAAAGRGNIAVVDRLLKAGADVNTEPSKYYGRTALQAAAGGGSMAVVDRLLGAGADPNATPSEYYGRTALQAAAGEGHITVVNRLLVAGADLNANPINEYGRTALQAAAERGHIHVVDRLLEAGADINAAPSRDHGRTALQAATEGGHIAIVNRLLEAGADVNAKPSIYEGHTALQAAASEGHMVVVDRLLEVGADVNAAPSEYYGRTALQAAAERGHLVAVDRLLKVGADLNAAPSEEYGRTALQAAAGRGHIVVVDRLLEAGANVNASPSWKYGRTALQAAAGGGHTAVAERLLKAGADPNAAPSGEYGYTALQAAASGGHMTIINTLLEVGVEVNVVPPWKYGHSALQLAIQAGHVAVADKLVQAGAV